MKIRHKPWQWLAVCAALAMMLVTAGCGSESGQAGMWVVSAVDWYTSDWVPTSWSSSWGYRSDPGYVWLAVGLRVANTKQESASINWFLDSMKFVSRDGNKYDQRLQLNDPYNALQTYYNPQQAQAGDVFFEIPDWLDPTTGTLLINMSEGPKNLIIRLEGLPRR